jgi:tetratricopeptide (TPR) repeat protein
MTGTSDELSAAEESLAQALDLFADGEDRKASILLDKLVQRLRLLSVGGDRLPALRLWAIVLCAQEEWEQALLKYEQILSIASDDEDALWQSAQILLRNLERPEPARALIADRLLPLNRLPDYEDALRECEAALGIPRA